MADYSVEKAKKVLDNTDGTYKNVNDMGFIKTTGEMMEGDLKFPDNIGTQYGTGTDMEITYDGANGVLDTSLVAPSDLIIKCGANKTLKLDHAVWEDLNGSALQLQVQGTGVSRNASENTADFATNADLSDYLYDNYQNRHAWKLGSSIYPHIHWEQAQNNVPNFLVRYRWQREGQAKTTAWTDYKCNTAAFTYVSGTLNQICYGAAITPPEGYSLSDIIQLRVFRDNANTSTVFTGADPYTATVGITFVDIHIQQDTGGSRQALVK